MLLRLEASGPDQQEKTQSSLVFFFKKKKASHSHGSVRCLLNKQGWGQPEVLYPASLGCWTLKADCWTCTVALLLTTFVVFRCYLVFPRASCLSGMGKDSKIHGVNEKMKRNVTSTGCRLQYFNTRSSQEEEITRALPLWHASYTRLKIMCIRQD